jgi:hypothetical protein
MSQSPATSTIPSPAGTPAEIAAEIARLAGELKEEVRRGIGRHGVVDVAFMGGLSEIYLLRPALNLDLDFFVLTERRDAVIGSWLLELRCWLLARRLLAAIECDVRVVRGPVKHVPQTLDSGYMTLHPAVFTEEEYHRMSPVLRWGWRKYSCEVDAGRLRRWAPARRPDVEALLSCRGGILRTLEHVRAGVVELREWALPDFAEQVALVSDGDASFDEYCLTKVATLARSHARCLGHAEPDSLPNEAFAAWYYEHVHASEAFTRAMIAKEDVRRLGYAAAPRDTKDLATRFLTELAQECRSPRSGAAASQSISVRGEDQW